jgi:hypothetical protein
MHTKYPNPTFIFIHKKHVGRIITTASSLKLLKINNEKEVSTAYRLKQNPN